MNEKLSFKLNDKPVQMETDPERALLWVLRTDLGLTGTKFGCGEGHCGCCTVLVNGVAVRSCLVPLSAVKGKEVVTIEGLEKNGELHPVQKAFIEHDALQCGFCIPGQVISGVSLLNRKPHPSREEIIQGMNNNFCRCGAHTRIIDAILAAAAEMKGAATMNSNELLAFNFKDITDLSELFPQNRRDFLKRLGGGIVILVALGDYASAQEGMSAPRGARPGLPSDFNAFLRIGEDGRVTCFHRQDRDGPGADHVAAANGGRGTGRAAGDGGHGHGRHGSLSVGHGDVRIDDHALFRSGPARRGGRGEGGPAGARGGNRSRCRRRNWSPRMASIFDKENRERRVTYGQLAKGQKIQRHASSKPSLKEPSQFKVMGKAALHKDARGKVTGKAQYTGDIRLPGMLYAKLVRPPAHGAKLKSVDTTAAKKIAGVQVVQDGDFVAVLHALPDVAETALLEIKAEFDVPEAKVDDKTIFDHLMSVAPAATVASKGGDLEEGKKLAAKKAETKFLNSYVAHASMETHTAVAKIEGDKATVWASTQNPFGAQGRDRASDRVSRAKRPGDHAVCWRRVRRKNFQPPGRRSGAPRQGDRQAGASDVEPGRGILLRHLPSGGHRQYQLRNRRGRKDFILGLRSRVCRRPRRATFLRDSESSDGIARQRLAGAAGIASVRHRRLARPGQ